MARPKKTPVLEAYRLETIRAAASRVTARDGVDGATMQAIADEAGVAKGTLYLYFKSRDELIESVGDTALEELISRLGQVVESAGSFAEVFEHFVATNLEFFDENHDLFRVYHDMVERNQGVRRHRACHPTYQQYIDALQSRLQRAMDDGEIKRLDPERLAIFIAEGIVPILIKRLTESPSIPVEEDVELIAGTILQGLMTERRTS